MEKTKEYLLEEGTLKEFCDKFWKYSPSIGYEIYKGACPQEHIDYWAKILEEYGSQRFREGQEESKVFNIEKLINQYKKEEMPDADSPYHHEAEIASGFKYFIEWLKKN